MSIDAFFLFIGLTANVTVLFYIAFLQHRIENAIIDSAGKLEDIQKETNGMRMQLEGAARAQGRREGIAEEKADEIQRKKDQA